jgi:kynureninase
VPGESLRSYRRHFPILDSSTYLISNSLGAMPAEVEAGLSEYARSWSTRGVRAWAEGWWTLASRVADRLAPLLGAPLGSVCMQPSTTLASAVFLSCLRPDGRRSKIVTTELQFPSIQYLLAGWCEHNAVDLEILPSDDAWGTGLETLLSAVDDRTLAVVVSHVEFATAWINDAAAIAARCRRQGALLLLDVFQSAGTLPLALHEWGVDAAVGGCLKWLCGGPGNAYLYIDPEIAKRLEPRLTGWAAHAAPFSFEAPPIRWAEAASRFANGTPQIAALHAAEPGLRILGEVGVECIRERSLELGAHLSAGAEARDLPLACPPDPEQRGGTVALSVPQGELVARELLERDIVIDFRPATGIRVAPHFYNNEQECDRCLDAIVEILADGSWRRHRGVAGASPT